MADLVSQFKRTLRKHAMLEDGDRILVAVSGGPDSVALLHLFHSISSRQNLELAVAHLNHMTRDKDSDADADFVMTLSKELGLPLFIKRIDVVQERSLLKTSFQEAARILRYGFMADVLSKWGGNKIALGHTADDQVETVLMNFLRGSGASGLSGIPSVREPYIRPLIECYRRQVSWYLRKRNFSYCSDASNQDRRYLRNRIRLDLLPRLESEYNFRSKTRLLQAAEIFRNEDSYLEDCMRKVFEECLVSRFDEKEVVLDRERFMLVHPAIRRRLVREAIRQIKGDIRRLAASHVLSIDRLAVVGAPGKKLCLPGGLEIVVQRSEFTFRRVLKDDYIESINGSEIKPLALKIPGKTFISGVGIVIHASLINSARFDWDCISPDEVFLDYEKTGPEISVRFRMPGDQYVPLGMSGRKKLKSYFIDEKIPKEARWTIPVLTNAEGHIIWVYGTRIAHDFRITNETTKVLNLKGCRTS